MGPQKRTRRLHQACVCVRACALQAAHYPGGQGSGLLSAQLGTGKLCSGTLWSPGWGQPHPVMGSRKVSRRGTWVSFVFFSAPLSIPPFFMPPFSPCPRTNKVGTAGAKAHIYLLLLGMPRL